MSGGGGAVHGGDFSAGEELYSSSTFRHVDFELERWLTGDCREARRVAVSDLVLGVSVILGRVPLLACRVLDSNRDGRVGVDELVEAVATALRGE